jgi:hypothetical protein
MTMKEPSETHPSIGKTQKLQNPSSRAFCEKVSAGSTAPVHASLQSAEHLVLEPGVSTAHCSPPGKRGKLLSAWCFARAKFVVEKPTLLSGEQGGHIGERADPNRKQGSPQSLPHARKQSPNVKNAAPSVSANRSISIRTSSIA